MCAHSRPTLSCLCSSLCCSKPLMSAGTASQSLPGFGSRQGSIAAPLPTTGSMWRLSPCFIIGVSDLQSLGPLHSPSAPGSLAFKGSGDLLNLRWWNALKFEAHLSAIHLLCRASPCAKLQGKQSFTHLEEFLVDLCEWLFFVCLHAYRWNRSLSDPTLV